jgi:hypothetical protein
LVRAVEERHADYCDGPRALAEPLAAYRVRVQDFPKVS